MKYKRSLILAAAPMEAEELRTIFSDQSGSIRRTLEQPPRLRDMGWDLPSMTHAEFVRGELIRVVEGDRLIVDLYRDGTFVLGGQVSRDFLAWADKSDSRLHPLALIELTANFTRFYRAVLDDFRTAPQQIKFRIELRNMHLEGQKCQLGSGPVERFSRFGMGATEAPADAWGWELLIASGSYNPERVAFLLIRELYLWFGHSEEDIPYTIGSGEDRMIDANQIAGIR